jgi:hypothetical protein
VYHLKHAYNKHYKDCDGKVKDKQLQLLHDDKIINPYFTQNPVVKYLYCTDQIELFRPTEYYIVYDFETMEEIIEDDDEQNTHIDVEDSKESSSSSSSSDITKKKSTDKISHITLLSATWCAKTKSGTKFGYYDLRDGEDFIVKWLRSLMDVAVEVERDNRYDCIDYSVNKIMNYVPVLGYNSSKFDMNFLINILHYPPNYHAESIIGNLIYFKQVTVRVADGTCLKFLDAMNYAPPQTLDSL